MDSFASLISQIGTGTLAIAFGIDAGHVRTMRNRNSIPVEYWPALIVVAQSKSIEGLTYETLQALRPSRQKQREAA